MVVSRFCAYVFLTCSIVEAGLFPDESDNEIVQISLGEADGIENALAAAFKGLVFHLNDCVPAVSDVIERGDKSAPVHIAEAGNLRAHVVKRIRQNSAFLQFLRIELGILDMKKSS